MAGNFADALLQVGLTTEDEVKKLQQIQKTKDGQKIGQMKGKVPAASLLNLEKADTVSEFKEQAKKILLEFPEIEVAKEIARLAENIKQLGGGKKLIWLILNLRDNLGRVKADKRENVIKRALRSSNPTVDIPPDWYL